MIRVIFCLAAAIGVAMTASAQEQVVVQLIIKDAKFFEPRFQAPSVRYELREDDLYDPYEQAIHHHAPSVRVRRGKFFYAEWPIDKDDAVKNFAHYVFPDLYVQDFVPTNEFLLSVQLSPERTNAGPVVTELSFDSRASIANSYKRQVNELTRIVRPTDNQNLSAYSAANSAITLSPEPDNFLLLARALKHSLRTGKDTSLAPLSKAQLSALPGYEELSFENQWTIQTEILDTLTAADDLRIPIDRTHTVLDAAIALGTDMIDQIDFDNEEQTRLRIVRVYQTLSFLHFENEDCIALQDSNEEALARSEAIAMNWSAQRVLMLDWGTCLERMTGFGSGLSEEQIAEKAAQNAPLKAAWIRYLTSADLIKDRLELATGASAERISSLLEFATAIQNWRE